ncbi:ABC transporter substrate-binding protein [Streptomyces exfoliatus]|uniref:ABC transporter substrate-binding protein n=1 Tax=Streptomyces exfoliatus TaxID=1905 RepID=UPI003C2EF280
MTPSPSRGRSPRRLRPALVAGAVSAALLLTGCSGGAGAAGAGDTSGDQLLTVPREDMGTFTRNFNPFSPKAAPMTKEAVYEPLMVHNPADGKDTPWLATAWTQAPDGKSVTFTLREGVKWSDGKPFGAADVVHTFELHKKLLGGYEYLREVTADTPQKVTFHFTKPFSPSLYEIGGHYIVPKHIWSKIADPARDTNATPVGTGPYTQVEHFQSQSYELRRNPSYWQPAKQRIAGIRMLAFSGNDSANLAFTNGEADWTQAFVPDIQKSFVAKNPKTNHYWFPTTGAMINWQLNTAKAPFDDPALRKALSRAVDREKIAKVAMNGYSTPADCTGLSNAYDTWRDKAVAASCDWTTHDTEAAAEALDAAGYELGADGRRTQKNGRPLTLDISVGSASSDWISVANIIKQNLAEVGVTATVKSPDWSAVVSSYETGTFDSGIVWSNNGATPYEFYRGAMATTMVKPVGTKATENYHRYGDPKADKLIDALAATSDPKVQRARASELQKLFAAAAPVVPLFPGPEWGAYTDARFTGWPTKDNPYATLSNRSVTTVLVLTSLQPVKG